jgi:RNA polymerase sigma factor (sigma-70 family)
MSTITSADELIDDLSKGNPEALGKLSNIFSPALLGFATKLLHEQFMAKDILQDVYLKLWQRQEKFDSLESVKKYLYVAVRNACINQNEKYRVRQGNVVLSDQVEPDDVMRKLILSEYLGIIYQVVEELPDRLKQVFLLTFEDGLSPEEIAVGLNIPKQTVKNRKVEVYKILREKMKYYKYSVPILLKILFL